MKKVIEINVNIQIPISIGMFVEITSPYDFNPDHSKMIIKLRNKTANSSKVYAIAASATISESSTTDYRIPISIFVQNKYRKTAQKQFVHTDSRKCTQ